MRDLDSVAVLRQIVSEMRDKDCAGPFTIGTWADRIETAIQSQQDGAQGGEAVDVRLWDSQWVNIVNHADCYRDFDKEEAVAKAVKLTEQTMALNFRVHSFPPPRPAIAPQATPAAVDDAIKAAFTAGWDLCWKRHCVSVHEVERDWRAHLRRCAEDQAEAALAPQSAQGES